MDNCLIENQGRRHGGVEGLLSPGHGDGQGMSAGAGDFRADAMGLAAHHQGQLAD